VAVGSSEIRSINLLGLQYGTNSWDDFGAGPLQGRIITVAKACQGRVLFPLAQPLTGQAEVIGLVCNGPERRRSSLGMTLVRVRACLFSGLVVKYFQSGSIEVQNV
jgi:hypothetical protein